MTGDEALQAYSPLPKTEKFKMKKLTLKEEFGIFFNKESAGWERIFEFFEPHLKKQKSPAIIIDEAKVIEFNNIFPTGKSGSGKRMQCNIKELTKAFQYFFKLYPETTWNHILQATELYVQEQSKDEFKYCRTAKYFCIKFKQPWQPESELIEYVERVIKGDVGEENKSYFDVKIY